MKEVMTETEVAEFLRQGLSTVRDLRRSKKIPRLPGKPARYLRSSLLDWLQSQEVQPIQVAADKPLPRSTCYKINKDKASLRAGIIR